MAMGLTFVAIYLLGNKARVGFAIMMGGNSCWVVVGLLTQSIALVIANAVFFAMNLRGFVRWAKEDSEQEEQTS